MLRAARRITIIALSALGGIAWAPGPSPGGDGKSPLMPPHSNAFGKSLEEWNVLWTERALGEGLGNGSDIPETVGRMRLLPADVNDPSPEFFVTLRPGTPFVATAFFVYGERYEDPSVPDDDPTVLAPLLEEILATSNVRIVLDGKVLLNGKGAALDPYLFDPVYFDEPIIYADPVPRGEGLNAVAALWVTGIGTVYHPLPVGEHTLEYIVTTNAFGDFHYTYHITVSPK